MIQHYICSWHTLLSDNGGNNILQQSLEQSICCNAQSSKTVKDSTSEEHFSYDARVLIAWHDENSWFISDQLGPDRNPVCTCFTMNCGETMHKTDRNHK